MVVGEERGRVVGTYVADAFREEESVQGVGECVVGYYGLGVGGVRVECYGAAG